VIVAELAEELARALLADHPREKTISLFAISVSHLEEHWDVELELPLGLTDEARCPAPKKALHVGGPTLPSIGFAIVSDGMPSDTDRWRWASRLPFPTNFANSPKGPVTVTSTPCVQRCVLLRQIGGGSEHRSPRERRNEIATNWVK
jgi:hypothetical protein